MKVKVRKILLCVFFALFIVTLFTASFSLGRYSSVQSSESDYDDDFEYTLYDSIVVNTIDEFFAAISNGYNYIIIGDAIKDPLIIAGSMSDIRDDLIIDLNGHEIQRNSRDPLLNVTTGFTLTIIDRVGTGSMYNPVGSVIQVSGGTLTVQNGIFESGPRSDDSRHALGIEANYGDYNEYATGSNNNWTTPGGGSISETAQVTVYGNQNIGSSNSDSEYTNIYENVTMPIITPKTTGRGVVNGSMYFDENTNPQYGSLDNNYIIENDTYLYYTYEAENMQFSNTADKSTANYYYQYEDKNLDTITVYVYNDVKKYANNGYYPVDSSSDNTGFGAVKMQEGNLYVRGGTYYSYFGEENTYCVESTGGLMSVNPTGTNAINFYAYQNGVCVECTVDKPTENEMLNISSGKFYSELGDTVRVKNGNLVIGTADFTKDVGNASANSFGDNGNVIDISGGTLTIDTRAGFDVSGSGVRGIYSHKGDAETRVTVTNATFTFNGTNNLHHNCGIYAEDGNVSCRGNTTINLSNGSEHNTGIYSAGNGYIAFGIPTSNGSVPKTKIDVAIRTSDTNYGIYSAGGSIYGYGQTTIALGSVGTQSTDSEGIHSEGGTINLGMAYTFTNGVSIAEGSTTITVNGDSSSLSNFGIQTIGGTINVFGNTEITVYGKSSTGVYSTVDDDDVTTKIVDNEEISIATGGNISISGKQFTCNVNMHWQGENDSIDYANNLSSTAISSAGGNIEINSDQVTINSDGLGITAFNRRMDANGRPINENLFNEVTDESNNTTSYIGTGNVDFEGENVDLTTVRGTAIYILGGALSTSTNSTIDVTSTIVDNLPWQGESGDPYSYDGIYVQSGSLISNGILNVKHVGVENDVSVANNINNGSVTIGNETVRGGQLHTQFDIKSYAVRVQAATGSASNVTILSGSITNSVGGGVYVSGGNVTLGEDLSEEPEVTPPTLSISSTGSGYSISNYGNNNSYIEYWVTPIRQGNANWSYRLPTTGGRALEVDGGTVTVYYGSYSANQGDALLVRGGIANIFGGTFIGNDNYQDRWDGPVCGPAASYAFKMYGGTANIYEGTFGDPERSGSGAFIMGTGATAETGLATANILGGTFEVSSGDSGGQAAISALEYATIIFGEEGDTAEDNGDIIATGRAGGLVIEGYANDSSGTYLAPNELNITIYSGTFRSTRSGSNSYNDGIWYNNTNTNLTINGGYFTGARGGITTERMPSDGQIIINNGEFHGYNAFNLDSRKLSSVSANDRVLINNGYFYGDGGDGDGGANGNVGFYFGVNPYRSGHNNVAIVGGTFEGNSAAILGVSYYIRVGDVFTTHTGDGRYGYCSNPYINGNAGAGSGGSINYITATRFTLDTKTRT